MRLIKKVGQKWSKISNASYENEIHRVDSPFGQGGPNFGEGTAGKVREKGQKQGNQLFCKLGSGQF